LKEQKNEKDKIKKEGESHIENFLKEKKSLNEEKANFENKIKNLIAEKLKNDMSAKLTESKMEQ
jgi:hypothetical protein